MAETHPILDLATRIERPCIGIDGRRCEIASPDELSAADHQRLGARVRRIDELMQKNELTAPEGTELAATVLQLSDGIMVGVPDELRAKLSEDQRLQVIEAFVTKLLLRRRIMAAAAIVRQSLEKPGEGPPPGTASRDGEQDA